jgi:hypothetical protein
MPFSKITGRACPMLGLNRLIPGRPDVTALERHLFRSVFRADGRRPSASVVVWPMAKASL